MTIQINNNIFCIDRNSCEKTYAEFIKWVKGLPNPWEKEGLPITATFAAVTLFGSVFVGSNLISSPNLNTYPAVSNVVFITADEVE